MGRTQSAAVIVVTCNRPTELQAALERWGASTPSPDQFVVVDASSDAPTRKGLVLAHHPALFSGPGSEYLVSPRASITAQRNLALDRVWTDVALFVDDDTLVGPGYLGRVREVYELDVEARIGGVGGISYRRQRARARLARAMARPLRLYARRLGVPDRVARPGHLGIPPQVSHLPLVRVRSLHGCAMSFRTPLLTALRFDETLRGYGYCEDFDISFRVSRTHALVVRTDALLEQTIPAGSAVPTQQYFFMQWVNPAYLTMKLFPEPANRRPLYRLLGLARARAALLARGGGGWRPPPPAWFDAAEEMAGYLFDSPAGELAARYRALEGLILDGSPLLDDPDGLRAWLERGHPATAPG